MKLLISQIFHIILKLRDRNSIVSLRSLPFMNNCQTLLIIAYIAIIQKRLSSYLVWLGVKFSNAKEEELLINDASQIGSKKFDFSIE